MSLFEVVLIAFGVAVDALAVSIGGALGCRRGSWRHAFNAALFFGGFQFVMPLIGFAGASALRSVVEEYDHWCAFAMLLLVGGKMIFEARRGPEAEARSCREDFFSARNLLLPAVATSLDALAVGAGIAFAGNSICFPAVMMGVVTGFCSAFGVWLGAKFRHFGGERIMTAVGGIVITGIGVKILLEHLMG